jgi:hypothetical protein
MKPVIGQWYKAPEIDPFKVVTIDEDDELIEVLYYDGSVEEFEFEHWDELVTMNGLERCDEPPNGADYDIF